MTPCHAQVHKAVLADGQAVAVKVQYPGVAKSIDSDINNLLSILKVWQILPKGELQGVVIYYV